MLETILDQYGIYILILALGSISQFMITSTFNRFSRVENTTGLTGGQIATDILKRNDFSDVQLQDNGSNDLTDHFDPRNKIVSLSSNIYHGDSVAAAAVAAHECGHVMQYQTKYAGIAVRNMILQPSIVAGQVWLIVVAIGFFLDFLGLIYVGIGLLGIAILFQVLTLPIEFDASKRALTTIKENGYVTDEQLPGCRKMLNAAAFTYVASTLGSLLTLMYYLNMANRRRR